MKRLLTLISISAFVGSSALFAQDAACNCNNECTSTIEVQGHEACEGLPCGYNANARIDVNCAWDVFITGSYIYWRPHEKGFVIAHDITTGDVTHYDLNPSLDFSYHSGFKIGIGKHFIKDNWTTCIEYTRFHFKDSNSLLLSTSNSSHYIYPKWTMSGALIHDATLFYGARGELDLGLDMIDWILARSYYSGTHFPLTPYFGLRGAWLDQDLYVLYKTNPDGPLYSVSTKGYLDSWFIGPRAGVDTNWQFGKGFRILGNISAALLYQHFNTKLKYYYEMPVADLAPLYDQYIKKSNSVSPNLDASIGMGWASYFDARKWHLDFVASYDFSCFWNQNDLNSLNDSLSQGTTYVQEKRHNLVLHGLTIKTQLDF